MTSAIESLKHRLKLPIEESIACLYEACEGRADLIPEVSRYIISSGGKRIRPLLTLACAELCGYKGGGGPALAAAVECIHTATLLHDDVVDNSTLRRGRSSANALWGNKESILVGDYLLSRAFDLMGRADSLPVYRILSGAAIVITEGEILQLEALHDGVWDEGRYYTVIAAKTAALFAAACAAPAAAVERPQDEVDLLHAFGIHLGTAFQLADDALDYFSPSAETGKPSGADFLEGKITLPLLTLREELKKTGREGELERLMHPDYRREESDFIYVQNLPEFSSVRSQVESRIRQESEEARSVLQESFPNSEIAGLMSELCVEVAVRTR